MISITHFSNFIDDLEIVQILYVCLYFCKFLQLIMTESQIFWVVSDFWTSWYVAYTLNSLDF